MVNVTLPICAAERQTADIRKFTTLRNGDSEFGHNQSRFIATREKVECEILLQQAPSTGTSRFIMQFDFTSRIISRWAKGVVEHMQLEREKIKRAISIQT